jgi:hypothetical protein
LHVLLGVDFFGYPIVALFGSWLLLFTLQKHYGKICNQKNSLIERLFFANWSDYSIGYPVCCQSCKPPSRVFTLVNPLAIKIDATRALDSSAGQVQ